MTPKPRRKARELYLCEVCGLYIWDHESYDDTCPCDCGKRKVTLFREVLKKGKRK